MLDGRVPELLLANQAPGASVAVSIGGERVLRAFGMADPAKRHPMTKTTIFRVASIAKPMTAFGVMDLHREEIVDIDAPITRYLRSWSLDDPAAERITLRRILCHTAGLGVHHYGTVAAMDPEPCTADVLDGACGPGTALELVTEPGEPVRYSSGGYMLAQQVVEDVTGRPFAGFMREAVFEPLGLDHTSMGEPVGVCAVGHDRAGRRVAPSYMPPASGGLCSTPEDLARFWGSLVTGPDGEPPGRGVIAPEDAREMLRVQATNPEGAIWGLGFCLGSSRLGPTYLHAGWSAGWWASVLGAADQGVSIAIAINSNTGHDWGMDLSREIVRVLTRY